MAWIDIHAMKIFFGEMVDFRLEGRQPEKQVYNLTMQVVDFKLEVDHLKSKSTTS